MLNNLFCSPQTPGMHVMHITTKRQNINTHRMEINKIKKKVSMLRQCLDCNCFKGPGATEAQLRASALTTLNTACFSQANGHMSQHRDSSLNSNYLGRRADLNYHPIPLTTPSNSEALHMLIHVLPLSHISNPDSSRI